MVTEDDEDDNVNRNNTFNIKHNNVFIVYKVINQSTVVCELN